MKTISNEQEKQQALQRVKEIGKILNGSNQEKTNLEKNLQTAVNQQEAIKKTIGEIKEQIKGVEDGLKSKNKELLGELSDIERALGKFAVSSAINAA